LLFEAAGDFAVDGAAEEEALEEGRGVGEAVGVFVFDLSADLRFQDGEEARGAVFDESG
jgi:hypothetical protein